MPSSSTVVSLRQPDEVEDPLTAVLRSGARRLLAQAIGAGLAHRALRPGSDRSRWPAAAPCGDGVYLQARMEPLLSLLPSSASPPSLPPFLRRPRPRRSLSLAPLFLNAAWWSGTTRLGL